MAIVRSATVIDQIPDAKLGGLIVRVYLIEVDTTKIAKEIQHGRFVDLHTEGDETVADAVAQLFPDYVLRSREEQARANEDLLIDAGMRLRTSDGKIEMTELAKAIDAVPVLGEEKEGENKGRFIVDLEAYGLRP